MASSDRASSYEINARRPKVGTIWVWELHKPAARQIIEVTSVKWNGEEWWVETRSLKPTFDPVFAELTGSAAAYWNDLSRFWEAAYHVASKAAGPAGGATTSGPPRPSELRDDG